jgi:plastocyanin
MKFADKCPKCGGNVQTKSVRKSIGIGFVNIPVAQFCLNPVCDWYQDFSEARKPEEIKENVIQIKIPSIKNKLPEKPSFSQKHTIALVVITAALGIYFVFAFLIPAVHFPEPQSQQRDVPKTNIPVSTAPNISDVVAARTPAAMPAVQEPKKYSVKMDVSHGFVPEAIIVNRSDIILWNNEENQRPRVVLISKNGLFENKRMEYSEKFPYQFNHSGNYTFVLAEFPSLKEYPNATGKVIVK